MNDSKLTPPPGNEPMSLRECRLILERLLVVAGTHPGLLLATRDALVDAQVLGVPVLDHLHAEPDLLEPAPTSFTRTSDHELVVAGSGQFALLLGPALTDAVLDDIRRRGSARLVVRDVRHPDHLSVLRPLLAARGVEASVESSNDGTVLAAQPSPAIDEVRTATLRAIQEGFQVRGSVWLELYLRSNLALVPDSATTRRHAGHGDVDEQGNIAHQMDDDADLEHALRTRSTDLR